jgi:hypothetical protein
MGLKEKVEQILNAGSENKVGAVVIEEKKENIYDLTTVAVLRKKGVLTYMQKFCYHGNNLVEVSGEVYLYEIERMKELLT